MMHLVQQERQDRKHSTEELDKIQKIRVDDMERSLQLNQQFNLQVMYFL